MLNQETKRMIDSSRQILVGKIPDPKAQVEQITTALIYKFMDDMDQEAKELGGKATFFSGNYKQYRWPNIIDRKLSGEERLDLYIRAITDLPNNEKLPQLFRDVFKNAFLPYRDAETLNLFLKEINRFSYDHSENLGNAFEYLLSILGSQGDAGQFRTPRHIIDFMVEVLAPKKDESVLDPACGTAGFLISTYMHIVKNNSGNYDPEEDKYSFDREEVDALGVQIQSNGKYKGEKLRPTERKKMQKNIIGYDISPDMVKLSLVNMYLHRFKEPQIFEYDTLTHDNRWDDDFDIILANPPFMSPKGGIRPHRRFSVTSNRSEVLFVDYIAEHLNINGRAGIIVPEGIIFKADKAYKSLRKMLIQNFLWAVVSLPSGIFQPYSGVKTSILFLDRKRTKSTDEILFIDIQSDGFDLGATRRRSDKNNLPEAFRLLVNDGSGRKKGEDEIAHWVKKEKIIKSGDYNLSGNSYKEVKTRPTKWPMVELGEVCEILDKRRRPVTKSDRKPGPYPYFGATGILDYVDQFIFNEKLVLVGEDGAKWSSGDKTAFIAKGKYWVNNHAHVLRPDKNKLIDELLVYILNQQDLTPFIRGITVPKLNQKKLCSISIPLPPLDIQKEVVTEIEGYQKIIDGAKQVVENWKPTIKIDPKWEMMELGEVCDVRDGTHDSPKYHSQGIPLITSRNLKSGYVDFKNVKYISQEDHNNISKRSKVDKGDVLFAMIGTIGYPIVVETNKDFSIKNIALFKFKNNKKLLNLFFKYLLESTYTREHLLPQSRGGSQKFISLTNFRKFIIPLPSLNIQKEIVAKIEEEKKIVESNKTLITIIKKKIERAIEDIWHSSEKDAKSD